MARFKNRFSLNFGPEHGEAADVNTSTMDPSHLEPSGSASPTPSRKQRAITLGVKKQVIDTLSSQNMSRTDVAKKFGIPRTTLKSILSQKEKIIRAMDEGADGKRIRLKNGKHVDLEKVLLRWVRIVKRHGGPITGNILKEKARELAGYLGIEGFQASSGWLENFKKRYTTDLKATSKMEPDRTPNDSTSDLLEHQDLDRNFGSTTNDVLSLAELEMGSRVDSSAVHSEMFNEDSVPSSSTDIDLSGLLSQLLPEIQQRINEELDDPDPLLQGIKIPMPQMEKRRAVTLDVKKEVIEGASKNLSMRELERNFNLTRRTIKRILDHKDTILKAIDDGVDVRRARLKQGKYVDVENALICWAKLAKSQGIHVNGPILKEKAKELAGHFNIEGFQASSGWLENFKKRYSTDLGKPKRKSSNVGTNEAPNQTSNDGRTGFSPEPEPGLTHADGPNTFSQNVDAMVKVENEDELLDFYDDTRDLTTTNGVLRMVELAEERARTMAGNAAMEDDSSMEPCYDGEDSDPDRFAFDQECSTSNEIAQVKSEIKDDNEDEPLSSGAVTIKHAQDAFKVVQKYIETNFVDPTVLGMCKDLGEVLANHT